MTVLARPGAGAPPRRRVHRAGRRPAGAGPGAPGPGRHPPARPRRAPRRPRPPRRRARGRRRPGRHGDPGARGRGRRGGGRRPGRATRSRALRAHAGGRAAAHGAQGAGRRASASSGWRWWAARPAPSWRRGALERARGLRSRAATACSSSAAATVVLRDLDRQRHAWPGWAASRGDLTLERAVVDRPRQRGRRQHRRRRRPGSPRWSSAGPARAASSSRAARSRRRDLTIAGAAEEDGMLGDCVQVLRGGLTPRAPASSWPAAARRWRPRAPRSGSTGWTPPAARRAASS